MDFIEHLLALLSQFALSVIEQTGYFGIFILSFLESAAIPIPSEVVVPFSGFLASQGTFSLWGVILVATAANLAGSIVLYWIGKSGGRWILERYGKYVLVSHHELEMGDRWFKKYGMKAIFFGRMLPVVRTFISLPAGITGINFMKFCIYTFIGALPWNGALAYLGLKAGENWMSIYESLHEFNYLVAGGVLALVVWYLFRHSKKRHG
jgi:membrane protein DedA with SNARE-associated domain